MASSIADIIFGRNPVLEALRAEHAITKILIASGSQMSGPLAQIARLAREQNIPTQFLPRPALDAAAGTGRHQGVVAKTEPYEYVSVEDILALARERNEPPFLLLLDHIQDVHNLGPLLRTAEAVGAHGVVIPADRAVGISAAVRKTSAGAVEHLKVAQVTNLVRAMEGLKKQGVWLVGLEKIADAEDFLDADLTGAIGLVLGSEGQGLGRLVRETCDRLVQLPMRGQIASLNASVAGSIVLYEVMKQRLRAAKR
ncbi:MAG: 23S rRNA (guanosine(2251)-2'-O)-methyltransferase RlmB [Chloroflexi bacterium]|nr:23S rRNA (guanosine(2251)-2'-O)-methyltransferase RlmB [Chloroflexota bacterium]MBI3733666.1 23S rRNA (guanosine(2251)-2'-O)-methyltransferase RlmB [Chloroflexota bacterium]